MASTHKCARCKSRILHHSLIMKCSMCRSDLHRECIPLSRDEYATMKTMEITWICPACIGSALPFNHCCDDDSFQTAVMENRYGISNQIEHINSEKHFCPFEINDFDDYMPLFSCDPDMHFYNEYAKSMFQKNNYYSIDTFNDLYNMKFTSDTSTFSVAHMNVASIPAHLGELDAYLAMLNINFSVICITENNLTTANADVYNLVGYNHSYLCKTVRN